jgi:predicted P-loop ATPase
MVGFGRREHTQIISAITTRSDPYRAAYGRHAEEHPRVTIFVATSENDEYLKDSRGVRRYWPVRCTDIGLDALGGAREQLFAEATAAFKAGASWHEMPAADTAAEQAERQEADVWLDPISGYCYGKDLVTVADVALHCLEIERGRQSQIDANRIARCLIRLGYACKVERVSGVPVRVYRRIPPLAPV